MGSVISFLKENVYDKIESGVAKTLFGKSTRQDLLESLEISGKSIIEDLLPMIEDLKSLDKKDLEAKVKIDKFIELYVRYFGRNKFDIKTIKDIILTLEIALENISTDYIKLYNVVNKHYPKLLFIGDQNSQSVYIAKVVTDISSIVTYSYDFLLYITYKIINPKDDGFMSKVRRDTFYESLPNFATVVKFYNDNPLKELVNDIEKIKSMPLPKDSSKLGMITSAFNKSKFIDVLPTNNFVYNPIYHFRLWLADGDIERYESLKDKKRLLELKILSLKAERDGEVNPKLEKRIEYYEDKIGKIEKKITEMEEEAGVEDDTSNNGTLY